MPKAGEARRPDRGQAGSSLARNNCSCPERRGRHDRAAARLPRPCGGRSRRRVRSTRRRRRERYRRPGSEGDDLEIHGESDLASTDASTNGISARAIQWPRRRDEPRVHERHRSALCRTPARGPIARSTASRMTSRCAKASPRSLTRRGPGRRPSSASAACGKPAGKVRQRARRACPVETVGTESNPGVYPASGHRPLRPEAYDVIPTQPRLARGFSCGRQPFVVDCALRCSRQVHPNGAPSKWHLKSFLSAPFRKLPRREAGLFLAPERTPLTCLRDGGSGVLATTKSVRQRLRAYSARRGFRSECSAASKERGAFRVRN